MLIGKDSRLGAEHTTYGLNYQCSAYWAIWVSTSWQNSDSWPGCFHSVRKKISVCMMSLLISNWVKNNKVYLYIHHLIESHWFIPLSFSDNDPDVITKSLSEWIHLSIKVLHFTPSLAFFYSIEKISFHIKIYYFFFFFNISEYFLVIYLYVII